MLGKVAPIVLTKFQPVTDAGSASYDVRSTCPDSLAVPAEPQVHCASMLQREADPIRRAVLPSDKLPRYLALQIKTMPTDLSNDVVRKVKITLPQINMFPSRIHQGYSRAQPKLAERIE